MTDIERYANKLGVYETVNGTWLQAIAQHFGVSTSNGTWIQAIAEHEGAVGTVNGTWIEALANAYGITTTDSTWIKAIADNYNPSPGIIAISTYIEDTGNNIFCAVESNAAIDTYYIVTFHLEVYGQENEESSWGSYSEDFDVTMLANETIAYGNTNLGLGTIDHIENWYISNISPNPAGTTPIEQNQEVITIGATFSDEGDLVFNFYANADATVDIDTEVEIVYNFDYAFNEDGEPVWTYDQESTIYMSISAGESTGDLTINFSGTYDEINVNYVFITGVSPNLQFNKIIEY